MGLFDADDVVPLITFDGTAYRVHEETMAFLSEVRTPIATISIAGKYRTGKSTLMNALCDSDDAVFSVGDTVQACTKGIHLRKTPLHVSDKVTVFLIDTEGIGSLNADSDHDTKILALALLLSSSFLYNSVGAIDEHSIQGLGLVNKVSSFVRIDADSAATNAALGSFFPRFYWCVRDFSLRLESSKGEACSESEYLEAALANVAEGGAEDDRNRIRTSLREAFPMRTLVTLPRPAESTQKLRRRAMSDKFLSAVNGLRMRLLDEIQPLRAGTHVMSGGMLARVCGSYVDALNKPGAVPTIRDSWALLGEIQARDATAAVLKAASEEMRTIVASGNGTRPAQLAQALGEVTDRSIADFEGRLMHPDPARSDELRQSLCEEAERHVRECQAALDRRAEAVMASLDEAATTDLGGLVVAIQKALRSYEAEEDPDHRGLDRWRAQCLDKLLAHWIPRILQASATERDLRQVESEEHKARCAEVERLLAEAREALARETERLRRDAELQVTSGTMALQLQLESREADLKEERSRGERLEAELADARLEVAMLMAKLQAALEGDEAGGAPGHGGSTKEEDAEADAQGGNAREGTNAEASGAGMEEGDSVASVASRRLAIERETEFRTLSDEVRELRTVRDTLTAQCERVAQERDQLQLAFEQRLKSLQTKQGEAVQKLRREYDETSRKLREEAHATAQRESEGRRELALAQQQVLRAEGIRDEGEQLRQREIRACHEAQLTTRAMMEDLQIRLLDMQRTSLADQREREQKHRERLEAVATEQLQAQVQRGEAQRREERALEDVRELKRKLTTNDDAHREAKKLKGDLDEQRARGEHLSTETMRLRVRLEEAVEERERLRKAHIAAESERAALKRELELVRLERELVVA